MSGRRVLVLGPGLGERGGMASRTRLIVGELRRRGWDVRYIGRAGSIRRPAFHRGPGLKGVDIPGMGSRLVGAVLFLVAALPLALAWSVRSSAVLAIQLTTPLTVGAVCRGLKPSLRLVASTTSSGSFSEVAYLERSRVPRLRRLIVSQATAVVAQHAGVAVELERLVPADRVAVVPTPVVRPTTRPALTGNNTVLYVGRFSEEKDLPTLLAAWRVVSAEYTTSKLVLVGAGGVYRDVEGELRTYVSDDAALAGSVEFVGWVEDVRAELRAADIFVLPSKIEGMSNALLEACSEGRVVVASRIPGNTEVLGSTYPLLFDPGDERALAGLLEEALAMGTAERAKVADLTFDAAGRFAVEAVVGVLEGLLLAASPRPRRSGVAL